MEPVGQLPLEGLNLVQNENSCPAERLHVRVAEAVLLQIERLEVIEDPIVDIEKNELQDGQLLGGQEQQVVCFVGGHVVIMSIGRREVNPLLL